MVSQSTLLELTEKVRSHVPIFSIGSAVLTGDSKPNGRSPVPISSQEKLTKVFYWLDRFRNVNSRYAIAHPALKRDQDGDHHNSNCISAFSYLSCLFLH
ncbi:MULTISPECIES: hypothetical protein [Cylindrospermopsis]|uniref:Uncharacterized protein n=1 Tax=Cylindrospermopsis curvispora GIHE-G1 TaxID=2666332 RepID=A0A7H0F5N5_9CYAN|nr:hypothetical protein [Cylindrospermopsis curvispora]MBU6346818.1 hypothetical protein [Cyanobacteria bacterium REEB494]QNP31351.1 hypothetical protein IAR63_17885 [Cylindrospermopsis curvispora GIHE-G1]